MHRDNGTRYGPDGYDCEGQDRAGFDRAGFFFDSFPEESRSHGYEAGWDRDTKAVRTRWVDCVGFDEINQDSVCNECTAVCR